MQEEKVSYGEEPIFNSSLNTAVVISHPCHELRIYNWIAQAHPIVYVLAHENNHDGHNGQGLNSTTELLQKLGAKPGSIYGCFSDEFIYKRILEQDNKFFLCLAEGLSTFLTNESIDLVAGDALEGFNPIHDICRYLIDAAVNRVSRQSGKSIYNYDFELIATPEFDNSSKANHSIQYKLNDECMQQKKKDCLRYPGLLDEITQYMPRQDVLNCNIECLHPITDHYSIYPYDETHPPYYETHGQDKVEMGCYNQVIRYQEHIAPLANVLHDWAETD